MLFKQAGPLLMLVAAVPALCEISQIEARSFRQLPGAHLQFEDLEDLAEAISAINALGHRGAVVTQGTDTIEESAFVLDRLLDMDMPVVVTGAMRNPTVAGADGPANLLAAVQVAISDQARGSGVLVVLNDEVHAARFVRKMHTTRPNSFCSPIAGPVGWITEGRVSFSCKLEKIPGVRASATKRSGLVALLTATLGDSGDQVKAICAAGFEGIVVEATGGGHVAPALAAALEDAAKQIPVVVASRTGTGETLASTYAFSGGEIDLQRRGLIRAGWLDGLKARVLLTLLLRNSVVGRADIAMAFEAWGGGGAQYQP
jgi:L-asparaginase